MSWSRWIKTLTGKAKAGGASAGSVTAGALSGPQDDSVQGKMARLQEERDELLRLEDERAAVHKKLKKRVIELKKEMNQQREANRKQVRELKTKVWDAETRAKQALVFYGKSVLYGTVNLQRPGMTPYCLPDPDVEMRRMAILRNHKRVWNQEMKLGAFHQYSPRPALRETFPKNAVPEADLPKVSVVTPSFRQAEYLEKTMMSVLGEKYPKLEYFVMDGGSKDGSLEVIQKHAGSLAGWVCEPDRGAAHAINKGFARATGDILAWINSDDLWMPGALRYAANYFASHPEVDVVYGHRLIIDQRDQQIAHWVLPRHEGQMLLWADFLPQETMFWRRSIWEKVGSQLDDTFSFAFDWDLLLRFHRAGARIVRLPYFMGSFRVHESQKSSAEINSAGVKEMGRLRERELGDNFDEDMLQYLVLRYQGKAVWCDRLRRLGIRW